MQVLTNTLAAIMTLSLLQAGNVSAEQAATMLPGVFPGSGGLARPMAGSDLPPAYPEWPERSVRSTMIPPPPLGPYMSSAMSGIDAFPSDSGGLRHGPGGQRVPPPFLDVDMPWPETAERDSPDAWIPESGEYRFVPDDLVKQLESPAPRRTQQNPGYRPYTGYPPPPPRRQPYFGYY